MVKRDSRYNTTSIIYPRYVEDPAREQNISEKLDKGMPGLDITKLAQRIERVTGDTEVGTF